MERYIFIFIMVLCAASEAHGRVIEAKNFERQEQIYLTLGKLHRDVWPRQSQVSDAKRLEQKNQIRLALGEKPQNGRGWMQQISDAERLEQKKRIRLAMGITMLPQTPRQDVDSQRLQEKIDAMQRVLEAKNQKLNKAQEKIRQLGSIEQDARIALVERDERQRWLNDEIDKLGESVTALKDNEGLKVVLQIFANLTGVGGFRIDPKSLKSEKVYDCDNKKFTDEQYARIEKIMVKIIKRTGVWTKLDRDLGREPKKCLLMFFIAHAQQKCAEVESWYKLESIDELIEKMDFLKEWNPSQRFEALKKEIKPVSEVISSAVNPAFKDKVELRLPKLEQGIARAMIRALLKEVKQIMARGETEVLKKSEDKEKFEVADAICGRLGWISKLNGSLMDKLSNEEEDIKLRLSFNCELENAVRFFDELKDKFTEKPMFDLSNVSWD